MAGAFGLLATTVVLAQQGGGGGGPGFSWDKDDAGNDSPTFWKAYLPNSKQLEPKWRMGAVGTMIYYHPTPLLSQELRVRVGTNGVFPDDEETFYAFRELAGYIYGQQNSIQGAKWRLTSRCDPGDDPFTPNPGHDDLQRKFDPGCQVSLYFRVKIGTAGDPSIYCLGNKTVTAP